MAGFLGSAAAFRLIAMTGFATTGLTLTPRVVALGFFNGMFAVAAIGSMMVQASQGRGGRMGLWGAAQAIAAGFGGLTGAVAVDIVRGLMADGPAFGAVFISEALNFCRCRCDAR